MQRNYCSEIFRIFEQMFLLTILFALIDPVFLLDGIFMHTETHKRTTGLEGIPFFCCACAASFGFRAA